MTINGDFKGRPREWRRERIGEGEREAKQEKYEKREREGGRERTLGE